jgi:hypothetical protein
MPWPTLIVYMNKQDFHNFLVRLAIVTIHYAYEIDGVKCIRQLVKHLVQPVPLMNMAVTLGVEVRSPLKSYAQKYHT